MTTEARVGFLLLFFIIWCFWGLLAWAVIAVVRRGRGALLALPLGLAGACAAGVAVPLLGQRDAAGFFLSMPAALAGSALSSIAALALATRIAGPQTPPAGSALDRPREK